MPPKILLLQARHADDPARSEEVRSFARAAGLPVESFVSHDLLAGPPTFASCFGFHLSVPAPYQPSREADELLKRFLKLVLG